MGLAHVELGYTRRADLRPLEGGLAGRIDRQAGFVDGDADAVRRVAEAHAAHCGTFDAELVLVVVDAGRFQAGRAALGAERTEERELRTRQLGCMDGAGHVVAGQLLQVHRDAAVVQEAELEAICLEVGAGVEHALDVGVELDQRRGLEAERAVRKALAEREVARLRLDDEALGELGPGLQVQVADEAAQAIRQRDGQVQRRDLQRERMQRQPQGFELLDVDAPHRRGPVLRVVVQLQRHARFGADQLGVLPGGDVQFQVGAQHRQLRELDARQVERRHRDPVAVVGDFAGIGMLDAAGETVLALGAAHAHRHVARPTLDQPAGQHRHVDALDVGVGIEAQVALLDLAFGDRHRCQVDLFAAALGKVHRQRRRVHAPAHRQAACQRGAELDVVEVADVDAGGFVFRAGVLVFLDLHGVEFVGRELEREAAHRDVAQRPGRDLHAHAASPVFVAQAVGVDAVDVEVGHFHFRQCAARPCVAGGPGLGVDQCRDGDVGQRGCALGPHGRLRAHVRRAGDGDVFDVEAVDADERLGIRDAALDRAGGHFFGGQGLAPGLAQVQATERDAARNGTAGLAGLEGDAAFQCVVERPVVVEHRAQATQ